MSDQKSFMNPNTMQISDNESNHESKNEQQVSNEDETLLKEKDSFLKKKSSFNNQGSPTKSRQGSPTKIPNKYQKDNMILEQNEENPENKPREEEGEGFGKFNYVNGKINGDYEGRCKTTGKKVNLCLIIC